MDKDFLLETETARSCSTTTQKKHRFWITIVILIPGRSLRIVSSTISPRYGWAVTTTSGVSCVPAVLTRSTSPVMHPITRSSANGQSAWARLSANPLFHWSHLELQRYFGYNGVLNKNSADEVWNLCNEKLHQPSMSVRNLIKQSNVTLICTTDDPIDSLEWHKKLAADDTFDVKVLPAWRPDKAMNIEKPDYLDYLEKLAAAAGMTEINSFASLKEALKNRMAFFASMGCNVSDHALEYVMYYPASDDELEEIFLKRLNKMVLTKEEELKFKTAFMLFVGREYPGP